MKYKVGDKVICHPKSGIGAYEDKAKFDGCITTIKTILHIMKASGKRGSQGRFPYMLDLPTGRLWSDNELDDALIVKLKMLDEA